MDAEIKTTSLVKPRKGGPGKKDKSYSRLEGRGNEYLYTRKGSANIYVRTKKAFKSTGTSNTAQARLRRDEIISQATGVPARRQLRKTVGEIYSQLLKDKEPTIDYDTYRNHYVYPWKLMKEDFEEIFIDELTKAHWTTFVAKTKRKYPNRNMAGYHTILNAIVKSALDSKVLKNDPEIKLDRAKERESEVNPFPKKEAELALKNAEGTLFKVMFMMAKRGPRVKETRLLRKTFFNFDESVIELPGYFEGKRYTKTGKPRVIPMGSLKKVFKKWCEKAPGEFVMFDLASPTQPISENILREQWEEHRNNLGLKGGLYRFRHFSVVRMLMAGINPVVVAKIHGHDIKTLYRKYSKFLKDDLNQAMKSLDD